VCGARAWTGETNGARGRKIRLTGDDSILKGSGGEGEGGVGAAWRRSGRERERGREGGPGCGVEQRGAHERRVAARQWRAAGSARRGRRG
jgi:hypothetical protein